MKVRERQAEAIIRAGMTKRDGAAYRLRHHWGRRVEMFELELSGLDAYWRLGAAQGPAVWDDPNGRTNMVANYMPILIGICSAPATEVAVVRRCNVAFHSCTFVPIWFAAVHRSLDAHRSYLQLSSGGTILSVKRRGEAHEKSAADASERLRAELRSGETERYFQWGGVRQRCCERSERGDDEDFTEFRNVDARVCMGRNEANTGSKRVFDTEERDAALRAARVQRLTLAANKAARGRREIRAILSAMRAGLQDESTDESGEEGDESKGSEDV